MDNVFNHNNYFVKEHVGMFKAANNFDIYEPESGRLILECREEGLKFFAKYLRFTDYKRLTPFQIQLRIPKAGTVLTVRRGWTFWRSSVEVLDGNGQLVGTLRQRMLSIGGKFELLDAAGQHMCMLKGKWTGWEFTFVKENTTLARVTKKWAGIGKELFTTADNYMLAMDEKVPMEHPVRMMILGAVICVDMVLKE